MLQPMIPEPMIIALYFVFTFFPLAERSRTIPSRMTFYISSGQLFVLQMADDDMAFYSFQIDIARALKELIKKEIVVKWQKIVLGLKAG